MIVSELVSKLGFQVDDKGAKQFDSRLDGLRDSLNDFQRHINKVGNDTGALMKGIAAGVGFSLANVVLSAATAIGSAIVDTGKAAIKAGDDLTTTMNRLTSTTGSSQEAAKAYDLLYASARQTGTAILDTSKSFLALQPYAAKVGMTVADTIEMISGLQKGMLASGETASRAAETIRQISQGIRSNTLQGQEINSFLESSSPTVIEAFAKAIGHSSEELKKLASQGKLTRDVALKGLVAAGRAATEEFNKMEVPLSLAWSRAGVAITNFLGKLNRTLGINRALVKVIDAIGNAFDWLGRRVDDLQRFIDYLGGLRNILQTIASLILAYYMPALLAAVGPFAVAMVRGFLSAVVLLRNGFFAMAAAVWANAAPLAAIVLWFGIIEDFITWIRGGRSLFGERFGDFDKLTDKIKSGIDQLKDYIVSMANDVSATFQRMWESFLSNIPPGVRRLLGLDTASPVATMGDNLRGAIGSALAGAGWQTRDDGTVPAAPASNGPGAFGNFMNWLGGKIAILDQMLPTPNLTAMGQRNAQSFNTNSQNNTFNQSITVNANGTDSASVAAGAQAGGRRLMEDSSVRLGGSMALSLGIANPRSEAAAQ